MAATGEVESMKTEPIPTKEVEKPKRPENLCCYSQEECNLEKLKGFDFCHLHILEDKASPFKACSFISKSNGKRCPNPAPKLSEREKTYCLFHTKDSDLRKAVEERSKKRKRKHTENDEHSESLVTKGAHSHQSNSTVKNSSKRMKKIEGACNREEDYKRDEMLRVDSSWHGDYESDNESIDNEVDDPLRHAGVWTAEEITKVCRDKLLRLRALYMAQFDRLKHVFKNKRRKYLTAVKASEEGDGQDVQKEPISAFDVATKSYNKRYRKDALLQKQSKDKRLGAIPRSHNQILPHQRCTHYTDGNRCVSKIIPSTKFCIKHICHDPNQLLFLPCSHMLGGGKRCDTAIANVLLHDRCVLHLPHLDELTGSNLKEQLEKARELQKMKEKEIEEKRKDDIQAQEAILSNTSVPAAQIESGTADTLKRNDELHIFRQYTAGPPAISNSISKMPEPSTPLHGASKISKLTSNGSPVKPPQSPTTNIQIRIEPSKKPEIIFTDGVPLLSEIPSKPSSGSALHVATKICSKETNEVPKLEAGVYNTVNTPATPENALTNSSNVKQGTVLTGIFKLQESAGSTVGHANESNANKQNLEGDPQASSKGSTCNDS